MKKVLLSLLVIVTLFTVVGCGSSKNEKKEEAVDETLFKIGDVEFHLDTDKEFEGMKYKTSSGFKEIDNVTYSSTYMQYNYRTDDGANLFFFRILFYKGKDINFALKDFVGEDEKFELKDVKINNIDYKMIDEERTDGTIHHYFITKDGNTYILNFVSQKDIKDFETKVMNSIKFN